MNDIKIYGRDLVHSIQENKIQADKKTLQQLNELGDGIEILEIIYKPKKSSTFIQKNKQEVQQEYEIELIFKDKKENKMSKIAIQGIITVKRENDKPPGENVKNLNATLRTYLLQRKLERNLNREIQNFKNSVKGELKSDKIIKALYTFIDPNKSFISSSLDSSLKTPEKKNAVVEAVKNEDRELPRTEANEQKMTAEDAFYKQFQSGTLYRDTASWIDRIKDWWFSRF